LHEGESVSPALLRYFATHHGIAATADLVALGLTPNQIRTLVSSGVCERLRRNVYRFIGVPQSYEQRAAAACASAPDVVISHKSAGRLWGLRKCQTEQMHALTGVGSHRKLPGVVIHWSQLVPSDVVQRADGIRLTSPTRTLFDLGKVLNDPDLESVVEQALRLGMTNVAALQSIRARLQSPGRNGSAGLGHILDARQPGAKPADSHLELRVERAIKRAGLPRPIRQQQFTLDNGTSIRVDFYWPDLALVLEVDHDEWHGSRRDRAADKWRDRQVQRLGVDTIRVTDSDVEERMDQWIADLRVIINARSRAL
jgi:very-short-patch-repair endonuclease